MKGEGQSEAAPCPPSSKFELPVELPSVEEMLKILAVCIEVFEKEIDGPAGMRLIF